MLGNWQVPLLSAEVHFWRHDPPHWDRILTQIAAEGIPIVSTYLSWRRHEPSPGIIDLYGRTDPRLDVPRFLELCSRHGLLVQLKPGPWICAEETNGGYPDWLLEDRDLWELDAGGKPVLGYNSPFSHPVPCYLHPQYLQAAQNWLRAVADHVREWVWPSGPIVLVQLDNEPSHCFRDGATEAGHHPLTLAAFRDSQSDWAGFQSWLLAEHLRRLRSILAGAGLGDLIFAVNYNDHPVPTVPQDPALLRAAVRGVGGPDLYYEPPLSQSDVRRLALWAALAVAGEPVPWAPEVQCGIWRTPGSQPWSPVPTPAEQRFWYLAALAYGLRGLNFYMFAGRENWELAPIDNEGRPGSFLDPVRTAVRVIKSFPDWGLMRPVPSVAMAWPTSELREAWSERRDAQHQLLAGYQRLLDEGHLVAIGDDAGSLGRTGIPLVDPLAIEPSKPAGKLPIAASGGAIAILQHGPSSRALYVLNPSNKQVSVELQFCESELNAQLEPIAETGAPASIRDSATELLMGPWQASVYRLVATG